MKIVAVTHNGYLLEATTEELVQITGQTHLNTHPEHYDYNRRATLRAGTEIHIGPVWQHIQKVSGHAAERKSIAEQLRAAATVVETTMDVVSIPEAPKPDTDTQERIGA